MARPKRARAAHLGPERRRPQVLDVALKLAAERGIHAVHMDSVAEAAGVTKPSIYTCFRSRDDLLGALLAREEKRLFEGVMAALPQSLDLSDPERFMTEGFRALFKVVEQHRDAWRLVLSAESDPGVAGRHREARRRVARRASQLAEGWLDLRGVPDAKRRLPVLVEIFMSICEGMVHSLLEGMEGWTADDLGAYVGPLVLAALERGAPLALV